MERCDAGLPERLILFRRNNEEENEADALNNIGVIHKLQGRYGKAMEFYEKSLEIKKRLGDRAGMATTYTGIGNLHDRQGLYDRAMEFY
ncbi:MAG: tetratricopeptide repeat protein [Nitrospinota bacterium]